MTHFFWKCYSKENFCSILIGSASDRKEECSSRMTISRALGSFLFLRHDTVPCRMSPEKEGVACFG